MYCSGMLMRVHTATLSPSLYVEDPGDPYLTLTQFAANSISNKGKISLYFLPGNHN
jgi:hypothetical protein